MIYLIRHTDTVADSTTVKGQGEYDVSEDGEEILDQLCDTLESLKISPNKIVSSDLNRAAYTGETIHNLFENKPEFEQYRELRETDFGDISSDEELNEFNESLNHMSKEEMYRKAFPNGESTYDVCRRARRIYNQIEKDEDNIIVTHMTPILCILSEIRGCSIYDVEDSIEHCECIPITEDGQIQESYKITEN